MVVFDYLDIYTEYFILIPCLFYNLIFHKLTWLGLYFNIYSKIPSSKNQSTLNYVFQYC